MSLVSARASFSSEWDRLALPPAARESPFDALYWPVATWVAGRHRPFLLGVNGAQGSGKSTFCALLSDVLTVGHGRSVVTLSIDDFYLTRRERQTLARTVHPLCAIRGVPGTHDTGLARATIERLLGAGTTDRTHIPRFDKAVDDRKAEADVFVGAPDIVLFEGWCVGATPGPVPTAPFNAREARDDPNSTWAAWSHSAMGGEYQRLFRQLDALIMIQVSGMDAVRQGRWRQEERLHKRARSTAATEASVGLMSRAEVEDYVDLFERQTTAMLQDMPDRSDILITRDDDFTYGLARCGRADNGK